MSLLAVVVAVALGRPQLDPNQFVWRTYKEGAQSKAQDQRIVVMDTIADFQRYCNTYGPEGVGNGRDVDWVKEELIAIHLGQRDSGGYKVGVTTIKKTKANEATVYWAEFTPPKGVSHSKDATSPWTIIRLNRPGYRLAFEGHREEGTLPGGIRIISLGDGYEPGCKCCEKCIREHENRLGWQSFAYGDDAPAVTPSTCVMNSALEYERYRQSYGMTGLPQEPNVDWNRERLLAIHLGHKFTGGYQILIDHIDIVDGTRVNVSYLEVQPTNQVRTAYSTTGPYLIVRVPRVRGTVSFSKKSILDTQPIRLDSCDCGCDSCRYCGHKN
ncbi:MAG TPA: protease complex subunit PrcB family protein [Fimbriimonadaceae bacterium]|nr:protease complex subunit PrcB family protein [Fimbriimonadaceae bacterium]